MIESFSCLYKTQIPLLNQIQQVETTSYISLGDADDQTIIPLYELAFGELELAASLIKHIKSLRCLCGSAFSNYRLAIQVMQNS